MKDRKNIFLVIILTFFITVILFAMALFALNKSGYLSFNTKDNLSAPMSDIIDKKTNNSIINNKEDSSTKNGSTATDGSTTSDNTINNRITENAEIMKKADTNMTAEEVFNLWKKIKGNWATIEYKNDLCVGLSVEINYYIKFAKFNSDGITNWNIISYEKINQNQYNINLITPVDLINEMSGDIVAHYLTITVDISKINDKILRIYNNDSYVDYQYVGENNGEVRNFQHVDGGLRQEDYCKWYKENY